MGELTRANMSRIGHKLTAGALARKKSELAFLIVFLTTLSFFAGYVVGSLWPMKREAPEWAEKFGVEAAKRHGGPGSRGK